MPKGIYSHKNKPSNFTKGHTINVGRKFSPARNKKISIANKGKVSEWKGKTGRYSAKTLEKMRLARIGKKQSEQHKINQSLAKKGKPHIISENGMKSFRNKMSGKNHPNWKGGISKDCHSISEPKYRKWRSGVFTRDNWTCQTCGIRGVYLEAHHIKSWKDYPDFRHDINNGQTLCLHCHKNIHFFELYR